jgi:hypothetical protein
MDLEQRSGKLTAGQVHWKKVQLLLGQGKYKMSLEHLFMIE